MSIPKIILEEKNVIIDGRKYSLKKTVFPYYLREPFIYSEKNSEPEFWVAVTPDGKIYVFKDGEEYVAE